ncbi:hypothetical protein BDZ45DRAFT_782930 [Acephala macrosclerotiorum]|nr:hypothetical protein BDZ45DRAFT_782930 [Acephala macrosclerotiorum]
MFCVSKKKGRLDSHSSARGCRFRHAKRLPSYPYNITRATLFSSYANILLVFLPLGVVANALGWADPIVFILNLLAVIPLASLIAFSTRELSGSVGLVFGRLLKATLSNIFEIIVGVVAVSKGEIVIAQSSLLGSMLFDSLLVICPAFQRIVAFSKILTNIMSSLIIVASVALVVPTTLSTQIIPSELTTTLQETNLLLLSRCTAIILLLLFAVYVYFQLKTHTDLFLFLDPTQEDHRESGSTLERCQMIQPVSRRESTLSDSNANAPTLSLRVSASILLASTACITICIAYLISTSSSVSTSNFKLSQIFIGVVLLPTAGNVGKCAALIAISRKRRIDFAIRTILNSVLQISLLIIPFLILFAWTLGVPMMLNFDVFEATVFLLAIIVVSLVVQDGKTNYFEGIMLIGTYIVIMVSFYIRPVVIGDTVAAGPEL